MIDITELRRRLNKAGWDAPTLAEKMVAVGYQISDQTAARWISGLGVPTPSALPFLAQVLGCNVTDIEVVKAEL